MRIENIQDLFIPTATPIRQAMKQLNDTRGKTLFVVDEQDVLFGAITDGDIRRWILSDGTLDAEVSEACNTQPLYFMEQDAEQAKREMIEKNITCLPIIDKDRKIVDLIFWEDLFGDNKLTTPHTPLDVPVVIMAGGIGTRLDLVTKILPKPLLPIGDQTIIEMIIDRFVDCSVAEFFISVNFKAKLIKAYFEEVNPSYSVHYIEEDMPRGTVGCVKLIKDQIQGDFILTNCDIVIEIDYADLVDFHRTNSFDLTLVGSLMHYKIPYGVCEISKGGHLEKLTEKPELNFLASTGMYVLNTRILDLIPDDKVYHMTQLIDDAKKKGIKIGLYPIGEKSWYDTGNWTAFQDTMERLH